MRVKNRRRPTIATVLSQGQPLLERHAVQLGRTEYRLSAMEAAGMPLRAGLVFGHADTLESVIQAVGWRRSKKRWPAPLVAPGHAVFVYLVHGDPVLARHGSLHRPRSRHHHRRPRPQGRKFRREQALGMVKAGIRSCRAVWAIMDFHRMRRDDKELDSIYRACRRAEGLPERHIKDLSEIDVTIIGNEGEA